jgi:diguanylate cyclase (GGDEF)-like protein
MRRTALSLLLGAALALGAPAGWLLLRVAQGAPAAVELRANAGLYAYLLVGTVIAFTTFGAAIGSLLDRLAAANDELHELSTLDPLTGLPNLRKFSERLELETARARRLHVPLSLIVLDLDHFKQLNDHLGHEAGNAALVHLAGLLRTSVREVDLPCRIGGDEFAVICPNATRDGTTAVAERVRAALERTPFRVPDGKLVTPTASLGVSALESDGHQLFRASDHALYSAKASGGNRVCQG